MTTKIARLGIMVVLVVVAAVGGFVGGTAATSARAQSAPLECIATGSGTLDPEYDYTPYVFWGWIFNATDDPEFAAKHEGVGYLGTGFSVACKRPNADPWW